MHRPGGYTKGEAYTRVTYQGGWIYQRGIDQRHINGMDMPGGTYQGGAIDQGL